MFKGKAKELKSLKGFGEMSVVTTKAKIQGKLNDRGTICVFLGYPKCYSSDVYRLLNPETNHVISSTDILWLEENSKIGVAKRLNVINDLTFWILLITMLTWNLKAKVVDIETAFLHGDLKETIYMEILKGMKAKDHECLILNKTINGLVQSTRKFYNKLVSALKDCGFKASSVDPCLWIKY